MFAPTLFAIAFSLCSAATGADSQPVLAQAIVVTDGEAPAVDVSTSREASTPGPERIEYHLEPALVLDSAQ